MGSGQTKYRLGLMLVLLSALLFSLSGVLTKLIAADTLTIACWRGLFGGVIVLAYVRWLGRGKPLGEIFGLGWRGWLLAMVGAVASLTFIWSFKLTYVANVAVIYATAPFLAAALGWFLMREMPNHRMLLAAVLSFAGVAVVVGGGFASGRIAGDIVAFVMTALNALYIVLIRHFRNTPAVLAGGVSALQLFIVSWVFADPLAVSQQDLAFLSLFGLSFAVAVILWTEGTRLITAADSALVGTSETPFAILLAWFVLAELPPLASFIGGGIVLATVLTYVLLEARIEASFAKGETK